MMLKQDKQLSDEAWTRQLNQGPNEREKESRIANCTTVHCRISGASNAHHQSLCESVILRSVWLMEAAKSGNLVCQN